MNRLSRWLLPLLVALSLPVGAEEANPGAGAPAPGSVETPPAPEPGTPTAVPAATAAPQPKPESFELKMSLTNLDLMHQKGLISQAEYDAALRDLMDLGARAASESTIVVGRFATTFYGFVEGDVIHDSTRSFVDLAGANPIAPPGTNAGDLGRTMFSVRNSRLGFRLKAPEVHGIRSSAQLEMDFFGNQPGTPPKDNSYSEAPFFNNPTFRVRHMILKMETDVLNVWVGQTWELVGWQGAFQPNTVAIQGVPGEIYSRTAQIRLTRSFDFGPAGLEIAVAALRPPQMDSMVPDLQGGLKLNLNALKGVQTIGQTGTAIAPASVGLSGGVRSYRLPLDTSPDANTTWVQGHVVAADLLVPIIPASERKAFAFTVLAEAAEGVGDADLYTSLTGGTGVGAPPGIKSTDYAKVANIDSGLAGFSSVDGSLSMVEWRSFIVSGQLYLPPSGNLWLSGAYSNTFSNNAQAFGSAASVFTHEVWWDLNLFVDVTPSTRFGLEYSSFTQDYVNHVEAVNQRVQLSGFFIF